ncbi:integrase, catalytic region, zinc finger, CCHC-type containing protein, partial [Tanacetum coccineum]
MVQNVQGRQNQNKRNFARGAGAAGNGGAHNKARNANAGQGKPIKCYNCNGLGHIARNCTQPKHPQNSNFFKDKIDLAQNDDNIIHDDECDAFDSDVDDEPTTQSIFMANLSSTGPANLQVGPSNASILSEVHNLENNIDHCDIDQDEHEIHNEVQQKNIIDSNVSNMGNSNVIPYEQYLSDNEVSVEPSCAPSVPINASVLHDNNAYIPHDPLVTELSIYKKQVAMYEQRAMFDLTLCEHKMDEQMRAQNPFYLRKAKVAQLALYDGDEILKTDHVPVSVASSKEDLEIAELTRQKMNEKMNDHVYVEKRIKIIPPNYSKENFLATFTPQTQLTPEQVFWSNDLLKQRAEDLKANSPPLPILAPMTVYPPNTPVHLVPRPLPTTSQVNIGLLDLSKLATTLNKLEISIQIGINKWYQSLLRNSDVSTYTNGVIKVLPPKTAEEILARERERKARTTLLMALPEDHLAKFNKMIDAKDMWDAIKSRFGGNDESKKKQKYILKQQFEGLF